MQLLQLRSGLGITAALAVFAAVATSAPKPPPDLIAAAVSPSDIRITGDWEIEVAVNHPDVRGMKIFADSLMALFP
jgi:hypothetical protein